MLTGLGMASAASMVSGPQLAAAAGYSPTQEAAALRTLHDSLETQWNAKDAGAMHATQAGLAVELAKLQAPQGMHQAMSPNAATAAAKATQENTQLGQELAALAAAHGNSASDLPLPGLGSLTALVQSLLATLLTLITGLLGGLPVPVAVPPLPVGKSVSGTAPAAAG
jgi:hypothetical protein